MHPSDIKIGQNEYRAYQLIEFIQEGRLKLEEKKKWDNTNMSMSIESILLGLTMTPIYIDASNPESWFVLDGRKRLQSLYHFFKGNFPLTNLDFFPDFNGVYFDNLPFTLRDKLEEAIFTVYSINQGVSEKVRLNLVLRIVPDLRSALSWEFKESLIDASLKDELLQWLNHPKYDFVKRQFKSNTKYRLVLEYLRLYYIEYYNKDINLHTNIEHVIFQLNDHHLLRQNEWDLGIERVFQIFNNDRYYLSNLYLNKKTIPILIFYFGTRIDNRIFNRIENHNTLFLEPWQQFYQKEGEKIFKRINPDEIYKKLDKLIRDDN
nr:DUF262 domain-containing protein [uncultured Carboxylicivirga sp.]